MATMGVRQRRKEGEKNGRGPDDRNATGGSASRGQEGGPVHFQWALH